MTGVQTCALPISVILKVDDRKSVESANSDTVSCQGVGCYSFDFRSTSTSYTLTTSYWQIILVYYFTL